MRSVSPQKTVYFPNGIINETGWICIAIVLYNLIWWHYNQNNESNKKEIENLKERLSKIERTIDK